MGGTVKRTKDPAIKRMESRLAKNLKGIFVLNIILFCSLNVGRADDGALNPSALNKAAGSGNLAYLEESSSGNSSSDNGTSLNEAARTGNLSLVKELLNKGAHLETLGPNRMTALHQAVWWDNLALAEYLIDSGARLEAMNRYRKTPLFLAVDRNYPEMVTFLIKKGANVNTHDEMDKTPLFSAIFHNQEEVATILVNEGAEIEVLPLLFTMFIGNFNMTSILLKGSTAGTIGKTFGLILFFIFILILGIFRFRNFWRKQKEDWARISSMRAEIK
jgi:ankyrin repeat protein